MTHKQQIANFLNGLRKVLFYVGHGKYNDHMSLDEVNRLKDKLEIILSLEEPFEKASTEEQIDDIYRRLEPYFEFSAKDFINKEITTI